MKKLFSLIAVLGLLSSCETEKEKIENAVVEAARVTLKNPDSFILDSLVGPDTLKLSDLMLIKQNILIENANSMAEQALEKSRYTYLYSYNEKMTALNEARKNYDEVEKYKVRVSEMKDSESDTIVAYSYTVFCRGTNSYGAIVKDDMKIYLNSKKVILKNGNEDLVTIITEL